MVYRFGFLIRLRGSPKEFYVKGPGVGSGLLSRSVSAPNLPSLRRSCTTLHCSETWCPTKSGHSRESLRVRSPLAPAPAPVCPFACHSLLHP